MPAVYDPRAIEESVSLSVNTDLLAKAAELDVNLSDTLEQALLEGYRSERAPVCRKSTYRTNWISGKH